MFNHTDTRLTDTERKRKTKLCQLQSDGHSCFVFSVTLVVTHQNGYRRTGSFDECFLQVGGLEVVESLKLSFLSAFK